MSLPTKRARVLFLTVMPSPYQRQLFEALYVDGRIDISAVYFTDTASDRNWSVGALSKFEEILPGTRLGWLGQSAHLNLGIARKLITHSADLVVVSDYSAPSTQIAIRVLSWVNKRWVFWGEIPGISKRGRIGAMVRQQLQRPIGRASAVAAIGSHAVNVYQKLFPATRTFNIPYFCDLSPFKAAAAQRKTESNETVDILFSGQLIERKGVDILIRAFAQISDQAPRLRLKLLGAGPARESFASMIPLRIKDRVHFLGFQEPAALPEIFASADVFVLPSRHDGWGVVVNEALGSGLPIVVSDCVGARDLVQNNRNGFITRAGDVEGLATALLRLGRSTTLRKAFRCESTQQAAHWDVDEGVRRWVDLSQQVLR